MVNTTTQLGKSIQLKTDYETALERVTAALKAEGFGILTRIDVHETFKQKLGVDFQHYTILGACNPHLAHRALTAAPEVGLLLPCNVTVSDGGDGTIAIGVVDPLALLRMVHHPDLELTAQEAHERLMRVVDSLRVLE